MRKSLIAIPALVLIGVGLMHWLSPGAEEELAFSTFLQTVERSPAAFHSGGIQISASRTRHHAVYKGTWQDGRAFFTSGYLSEPLLEKLRQARLPYEIVAPASDTWQPLLMGGLSFAAVLIVWFFLARLLGGGHAGLVRGLSRSPARRASKDQTKVTLLDDSLSRRARALPKLMALPPLACSWRMKKKNTTSRKIIGIQVTRMLPQSPFWSSAV